MSQYLDSLSIGDTMLCRGPNGKVEYCGRGLFRIKEPGKAERQCVARQVGLIAGGTGITPILQIVRAILKDTEDDTEVSLLFANQVGVHLEWGPPHLGVGTWSVWSGGPLIWFWRNACLGVGMRPFGSGSLLILEWGPADLRWKPFGNVLDNQ